jgi:hypothetical protein
VSPASTTFIPFYINPTALVLFQHVFRQVFIQTITNGKETLPDTALRPVLKLINRK